MRKDLEIALNNLEKKFGKGVVLGGDEKVDTLRIPTGSIGLNIATGGGYGVGRFTEFYSWESAGKTTMMIHAMVQAQKKYPDKFVLLIDAEHAFDTKYAENLGLNLDMFKISQPDSGEQGLDIIEELISTQCISLVGVDSVAALTPQSEIDGDMGDSKMGVHARLMSQACRKLTGIANKHNTPIIWLNQLREKIGVMFGNPETTTGGNALKFYASTRVELRRSQGDKDKEGVFKNIKVKAKVVKNKLAPPFQVATFTIVFGEGIDRCREILDIGTDLGFFNKSGSWYSYNDNKIGQGADNAKQFLEDNPELADEIESKIYQHFGIDV